MQCPDGCRRIIGIEGCTTCDCPSCQVSNMAITIIKQLQIIAIDGQVNGSSMIVKVVLVYNTYDAHQSAYCFK